MPNVMLRNDQANRFVDVTFSTGLGHLQKGHGVGFADVDNDGDQDIYHQLGGFFPSDKFRNALFANPGNGNHFVSIRLRGVDTNRNAIGARVCVTVNTENGPREIYRSVGMVSSFGGSTLRQEIGLGTASSIERIEIVWPTSPRNTETLTEIPLDSFIDVTQGKGWKPANSTRFALPN
jgi:hypothetical protein